MNLIPIAQKTLTVWRERTLFKSGWIGLTLASLIAIVSAGSWALLILGSH